MYVCNTGDDGNVRVNRVKVPVLRTQTRTQQLKT